MNNYILIIASDDKYFNCLVSFINNLKELSFNFENLIVYDLGIKNTNNKNILQNLINNLHFTQKIFEYAKYPDHCNLNKYNNNNCTYAWKPIIIYNEANNNPNKYVIWLDSKCKINKNTLPKICYYIENQGCWITISNRANTMEALRDFHPTCIKNMGLNESDRPYLEMKYAGLVGFNYKNELAKCILDEWYKYSLNKDVICPQGSSRSNHRQDQSVLSIIIYKLRDKIKLQNDNCGIKIWHYKI